MVSGSTAGVRMWRPGPLGTLVGVCGALAAATLATVLATSPWDTPATTVLDAAVGAAFMIAGLVAPGPRSARTLAALVGVAWLAAPFMARVTLAYLGVLGIALVAFPSGRPRGLAGWVVAGVAATAGLLPAGKPELAVLFAAVALEALGRRRMSPPSWIYPMTAGFAMAAYFGLSWAVEAQPEEFDPALWVAALAVVLIAIAVGFVVASRGVVRARAALTDVVLGDARLVGLGGLELVLREVLDDPRLRVYRWDPAGGAYVDRAGDPPTIDAGRGMVEVHADGAPVGSVVHAAAAMADPAVSSAVSDAVRLTVDNLRWQAALDAQLADLEAARARLVTATDRQRTSTATRLRLEVVEPTRRAAEALKTITDETDPANGTALAVAREQLEAAAGEVLGLVGGVPPTRLGDGRLADAIREVAGRCPVPVRVVEHAPIAAAADLEVALFYACSEALTNAVKHAQATRVSIDLRGGPRVLVATITDDGVGGADPSGAGLRGLADRLAARGGRLRVDSPPGAGTIIEAAVPV